MAKAKLLSDDPLPGPEPEIDLDERRTQFVNFVERWACRISFTATPDWRQVLTQIAVVGMDDDGSYNAELRECRRYAQLVGWSGVLQTIAERMRFDEAAAQKAQR